MSTPLRRVKLNYQPHAPRVCFALHKARFPFSQEATELLTNYDGRYRRAIPTVAASGPRCPVKNGRGRGARTPDLRFWRPPLYQLSYTPTKAFQETLAAFRTSAFIFKLAANDKRLSALTQIFLRYRSLCQNPAFDVTVASGEFASVHGSSEREEVHGTVSRPDDRAIAF